VDPRKTIEDLVREKLALEAQIQQLQALATVTIIDLMDRLGLTELVSDTAWTGHQNRRVTVQLIPENRQVHIQVLPRETQPEENNGNRTTA
jgi:hypothetical protein